MNLVGLRTSAKRFWVGFILGAISAGVLYWLFESYSHLWAAVERQFIPHDALVFFIPCVTFALLVSCAFGLPIIGYLASRGYLNLASILISSGILSTAAINFFHQSAPWEKPFSVVVGLGAGLIFYLLAGRHVISNRNST